jgi:uncharacterized protein YndB with AHSA1/START domain
MDSDKIVNKTVTINAPAAKVWELLSNPELTTKWLTEEGTTIVTSDWKVGNPITFSGTWHGIAYEDKGTILQVETEKVLTYSYWSKFSRLPDSPENYSVIEFRLEPAEKQTIITLIHSNLVAKGMYGHSNFYWAIALNRMKKLIEEL